MTTRRAMAAGLAAALVSGCGRRGDGTSAGPAAAAPALRPRPPRFGDASPHPWEGIRPADLPVHGIDVARWQVGIDWETARDHGVSFAYIKATEGADGTHVNPEFARQWRGSAAAGVLRGAYHLYYWCASPEAQARHFIEVAPREPGALPPAVDLEWNPRSPTCGARPAPPEVRDRVRRIADLISRHYGQRPILYLTPDFFDDTGMMHLEHEEFWLRSVASHPSGRYGRAGFSFWQYSGTGLVPGIAGRVDLNAFNGSAAHWRRWLAARGLR